MSPLFGTRKLETLPSRDEALPGRLTRTRIDDLHTVLGTSLTDNYPEDCEKAVFGMGCFWGVEKLFWQQPGVHTTAVGYSGGYTPNPSYEEVCTGRTGHNEVVLIVFHPAQISYTQLLRLFWENHDPTMGMRQGNDRGTQYRSGIYFFSEAQQKAAEQTRAAYAAQLEVSGAGRITTEILPASDFYFAEPYHQQYLDKNPGGYCNMLSRDRTGLPALGEGG